MKKLYLIFLVFILVLLGCNNFAIKRFPSNERSSELIGIYTGTFDPPTNAHKEIMLMALEKYHVDQLNIYINVSGTKDFKTSYLERLEMINGMLGAKASRVKIQPVLQENKEDVIAKVDTDVHTVQFSGQDSFDTMLT
jgi:nicotinic acid mononucleotide adenylyltransferase